MWIKGMVMAVIREKTVSTSAARVAGRRHSALASRRMAESITPAWLIPIQNTKLVIMKPHDTGRFSPVTPSPWLIIKPVALKAPRTTMPRTPTAGQNHRGVASTDRSRSRLTWVWLRTCPSCMEAPTP